MPPRGKDLVPRVVLLGGHWNMPMEGTVGPQSLSASGLLMEVFCSTPMLPTWESILDRGPKPETLQACTETSKIMSQRNRLLLLQMFHYISKAKGGAMYCVLACPSGCHGGTCSRDFLG